jgi:hypothetical protein
MSFTIICENNEKERCVMKNLKELTYDELVAHVEEVIKMLRLRAYEEGYEQGKFDAIAESSVKEARKLNAQLTRDEIIEKAKRDVVEWLDRPHIIVDGVKMKDVVTFIVNKEKRTVVALVRYAVTKKVKARGIAKCRPDDCFNVHIGRAIALRRALGLEVPDEYLNAPQPTEVRVGDIVESYSFKQPKRYIVVGTDKEVEEQDGCCHVSSIIATSFPYRTRIIDDSREWV